MSFYVTGGTLQSDAPSYVEREADRQLYEGLLQGDFCYVLTARQMGKSSLMVRTANRLRMAGVHVVALDLTALGGQNITAEQWYFGLLDTLGQELGLGDELEMFWQDNEHIGPLHRFMKSIRQFVLPRLDRTDDRMKPQAGADGPIPLLPSAAPVTQIDDKTARSVSTKVRLVIFVDEIDFVRSLPFSTDEFFAAIRECYNHRTLDSTYEQVTFCLLGVASPSDLIRDTRTTPFNIGRRIELNDFTPIEAAALAQGLEGTNPEYRHSKLVLDRILYWTEGHPYLTQRLCRTAAEALRVRAGPMAGSPAALVDRQCADLFFSARARERDDNLIFVRERLLRNDADLASVLDLYLKIWQGKRVMDDEFDPVISLLGLSGVARVSHGRLNVRNRIYYRVFDAEWVRSNLPEAEVRRQREAYRRGVIRTTALASIIMGLVSLAAVVALNKTSEANLAQAKAWRSSGRIGQRTEALRVIELAKRWGIQSGNLSEFQKEAIAALSLVDLKERRRNEHSTENSTARELNETFNRYAVGKKDGRIAIFNIEDTGDKLRLPGLDLPVRWLRFSPDNRYLAAEYGLESKTQGRFIVWSLASLRKVIDLQEPVSRDAVDFSWTGGRLALGLPHRGVRIYELVNSSIVFDSTSKEAHGEEYTVSCLRFDPFGERVAECREVSLVVNVWNVAQNVSKAYYHPSDVLSFDWSPDGYQLASACANGDIYLWDLPSNKKERLHRASGGLARANLRFNRMGTVLAAICSDLSLRLWRPQSGQQILASFDLQEPACLRFSSDDRLLNLTTQDGRVQLFDVVGGSELLTFHGEANSAAGFRSTGFDPAGRVLIAAGEASGIWLWDTQDHRTFKRIDLAKTISVCFDSAGTSFLASTGDGFFRVPWLTEVTNGNLAINLGRPQCLELPLGLDRFVLATNRLGAIIHADQASDHIHVFHVEKPEENYVLAADRELDSIAITPDGSWLAASASQGGTNLVWDLRKPSARAPCGSFPGSQDLTFSPSGRWLVTSWAGKFQFRKAGSWELSERLSIERLQNFERFSPMAFGRLAGPDECLLAIAISPTRIKLFRFLDRASPKLDELAELESPDRFPIMSLTFNSACSRLAAGSEGQIVQVWDLAGIREELQQRGLASNFPEFAVSHPDNRQLSFKISQANESERAIQHTQAEDWALVETLTQQIDAAERSGGTDCFSALIDRGRHYLHLKRYDQAQRDFNKALELRPDDATAQRAKARVEQLLTLKQAAPGAPDHHTDTNQP